MIVSAIVATAHDNVIGRDNAMPWYLPADLKYFQKTTMGHHIIMGKNSYKSIGNPLPKRTNIVLTRDPFWVATNVLVAHSIEEALTIAYDNGEKEAFIIGGGNIYKQTMNIIDKIYLTEIDLKVEDGEVFFPEIDMKKWDLISEDPHRANTKNEYDYNFKIYDRKTD